jgi:hypoxanthine phosphoribosyltransferase
MASLNLKGCMVIEDDFPGYPKDLFMIPKHYETSVESVLIPGGVIQVRTLCS